MVDDYVSRKQGLTPVQFLIPELEELTAETLGVIVYQDQVMQIAHRVAGYSLGEADLLRRAMGKKKPEEMARHRERFVAGAQANGIAPAKAEELFGLVAEFAGYAFAKAHAAAYALIMFQTAYLKANHPRAYLAALLSVESGNHDKLARYIAHARERKIEILPPDANESERDFTAVAEGIRFGLAGVKNVGEGAIEALLEARREAGPFRSIFDFCARIDGRRANRRVVESLVKCGAFDSLHENRAAVWAALDGALESGAVAQRDREIGQENLFAGLEEAPGTERPMPETPPWTDAERLAHEKEVLGFYVTGHPLTGCVEALRRYADTTPATASEKLGREVRAGGLLAELRETRTRRGATMAFASLEELDGSFELVIFAEPYGRLRGLLRRAADPGEGAPPLPLLVQGTLESVDPPKLLVSDAFPLAEAEQRLALHLRLRITAQEATRDRLLALRDVLAGHPGDCGVRLQLVIPGQSETRIALSDARGVQPDEALVRDVNGLFGRPVAELEL